MLRCEQSGIQPAGIFLAQPGPFLLPSTSHSFLPKSDGHASLLSLQLRKAASKPASTISDHPSPILPHSSKWTRELGNCVTHPISISIPILTIILIANIFLLLLLIMFDSQIRSQIPIQESQRARISSRTSRSRSRSRTCSPSKCTIFTTTTPRSITARSCSRSCSSATGRIGNGRIPRLWTECQGRFETGCDGCGGRGCAFARCKA